MSNTDIDSGMINSAVYWAIYWIIHSDIYSAVDLDIIYMV